MLFYFRFIFPLFLQLLGYSTHISSPSPARNPLTIKDAMSFGAISDGKKVIVSWSAGDDRSFDYFTVERSRDGVNFSSAVMIKGAGKIHNLIDYTDIDYNPYNGISYYRLKQTDYAGDSFYSEVVMVNFQVNKDGSVEPYINRQPDTTELKELESKILLVLLKDNKGEEHICKTQISGDNRYFHANDTKPALEKGAYLVMASSYNRLCSQTVIIR